MGCAMDDLQMLELVIFAGATFAAAVVAGVAGFAFGIVAAAGWLHFLSPVQTAALIAAFGLIVQGLSVWKLRRSLNLRRLLPFLIGGAVGVPIGIELLRWTSPATLRLAIGVVLILFALPAVASHGLPLQAAGLDGEAGPPVTIGRRRARGPPAALAAGGSRRGDDRASGTLPRGDRSQSMSQLTPGYC